MLSQTFIITLNENSCSLLFEGKFKKLWNRVLLSPGVRVSVLTSAGQVLSLGLLQAPEGHLLLAGPSLSVSGTPESGTHLALWQSSTGVHVHLWYTLLSVCLSEDVYHGSSLARSWACSQ